MITTGGPSDAGGFGDGLSHGSNVASFCFFMLACASALNVTKTPDPLTTSPFPEKRCSYHASGVPKS
jgi:hypothetical protein